MKTCPICKARCFDDMEICYGCMHPFGQVPGESVAAENETPHADERAPVPDASCDAEPRNEACEEQAKTKRPKKEAPRVFGALGEDEATQTETWMLDADEAHHAMRSFPGEDGAAPRLKLVEGPMAMASLGNGYRLVLAIERE